MIINKIIRKLVCVLWATGFMGVISITLFAQTSPAINQGVTSTTNPSATDILRASMKALSNLSAVEYEIELDEDRILFSYKMTKVRAKTKITAANSPLRAVAKLQGEDGGIYEMMTVNNNFMQSSVAGEIAESDLSRGFKPLVAYGDFNNTWQLLLDPEFFAKIIEGGRVLYAGQENIGNDMCDVIVHVTSNPQANIIATNYYWISTKTKLPRARQLLLMNKRGASLQTRRVITITNQNPPITPATFTYKPTEKDSVIPPSAKTDEQNTVKETVDSDDRELTEWKGKQLPLLIGEDVSLKKINFGEVINKPTLITFWATWCSPCLKEMPFFQKLVDKYKGKFQVLAVATMELNRPATIDFINKHPEYKFTFLLDPDGEKESSLIKTALNITALPTNLLVDSNGKIVSAWRGERKEAEWTELIDKLVAR